MKKLTIFMINGGSSFFSSSNSFSGYIVKEIGFGNKFLLDFVGGMDNNQCFDIDLERHLMKMN